jgi:hypothetical protein
MIAFDTNQKVTVLLAALQERYQALRTIRERVQSTGLWALGLLTAASGWLLQTTEPLDDPKRWAALGGLAAAVLILRFIYLADLKRGFDAQQRAAARLELALGFYEVGLFDDQSTSIYSARWLDAGKSKGAGKFFVSTYRLIYAGAIFLALSLILIR